MKKLLAILLLLAFCAPSFANHIAGGELFYEYVGPGSSTGRSVYRLTMRLFRDCNSTGQTLETESVVIGIYATGSNSFKQTVALELQRPIDTIGLNTNSIPCLQNAPQVCFQIGLFVGRVELQDTPDGYTLSWVRCCRSDNLANLSVFTGIGGTYVTYIPGSSTLLTGHNSSPQFAIRDTALVCKNKNFVLDFGATDKDGDSLSYAFCDAFSGGTPSNPNPGNERPPALPEVLSLNTLPYRAPFDGQNPLGTLVSINPQTGKITGTAPNAGRYVINVCVTEWRNRKAINKHQKDFILEIGSCDFVGSDPVPFTLVNSNPVPVRGAWCKEFDVNFINENASAAITSYEWDFGVPGVSNDTSTSPTPSYTYKDTGVYNVRLVVHGGRGCIDGSTTSLAVYPGFKVDYSFEGSCVENPFKFSDKTTAQYGVLTGWTWNFGDGATSLSPLKDPTYKYATSGDRTVKLIVTSSKGCIDSTSKTVPVRTVAQLELPFTDTLICSVDSLPIPIKSPGTFTWSPGYNIINANTAKPTVFPKQTTTYYVSVVDQGNCRNNDSVRVRVVDKVSLYAGADTTICTTDSIISSPVTDALKFTWSPSAGISGSALTKNAVLKPAQPTDYTLIGYVGSCTATDNIRVNTIPYPVANAGNDVTVCYDFPAQLSASIKGASFHWSPVSMLSDTNTLTPVARPLRTTSYSLTVYDTLGCPKPARDTVVVTVIPKVVAFAGNDTLIVANQPLQLNATGGTDYLWTPPVGMEDNHVANPLVVLDASYDTITYKVRASTPEGCYGEDEMRVVVFKTAPSQFVPSAFTPNNDSKNDILRPILVGMKQLVYFRIYNRLGQLLYSTSAIGQGWDGTFNGQQQPPATYVYAIQAVSYIGKTVTEKGTVVLIR